MKLGYVKDGGSHKKIDNLWCKDSGVWKQVIASWIKTSSGWTQWYSQALEAVLTNDFYMETPLSFYYGATPDLVWPPVGGSIAPNTYNDFTVQAIYWKSAPLAVTTMVISGVHPDSNDTFKSLTVGTTTYLRSDAVSYFTTADSSTWNWGYDIANPFGTVVGADIQIILT